MKQGFLKFCPLLLATARVPATATAAFEPFAQTVQRGSAEHKFDVVLESESNPFILEVLLAVRVVVGVTIRQFVAKSVSFVVIFRSSVAHLVK